MLARGDYKAKTQFVDDDNAEHLAYEYSFRSRRRTHALALAGSI